MIKTMKENKMTENAGMNVSFHTFITRIVRPNQLASDAERRIVYQARGQFPWRDDMSSFADVLDDFYMDGGCDDDNVKAVCSLWDKYRAYCQGQGFRNVPTSEQELQDYVPPWKRPGCWGKWFDNRGVPASKCPRYIGWKLSNPVLAIGEKTVIEQPTPEVYSIFDPELFSSYQLQAA